MGFTFPPSVRMTNALVAMSCLLLMLVALFLQEVDELHPCPLCISQRIAVIGVGLFALLACLHHPGQWGLRVYTGLQLLVALIGAGIAARHLWIQSLPADQVPSCGPGLQYIFENFPFMRALELLLAGDGSCAEVQLFLFLPIPAWVLLACTGFVCISVWQLFRLRRP
jgi:disulfide bond formation protein DsbB